MSFYRKLKSSLHYKRAIKLPYYPTYEHSPAYKHICLYPDHKHMCLYPVDIYQSVTKSIRFEITVITLILSQITGALATFFIKLRFLSL